MNEEQRQLLNEVKLNLEERGELLVRKVALVTELVRGVQQEIQRNSALLTKVDEALKDNKIVLLGAL
jgi:hypothetical protein